MTKDEVVQDDDFLPEFEQMPDGVGADVTSAAGN
jgi:hypothetical protein